METEKLIAMLARDPEPVAGHVVARRYGVALAVGGGVALALMAALLGIRPDLRDALRDPMFWVKLGLPALLLVSALAASARLGRPGARVRLAAASSLVPVVAIWLLAAAVLASTAPGERAALVLGDTWAWCLASIAVLAIPTFVAALWAMKGLAPTRPVLAGAFSGLLAGAVGAVVYTLHCPEMAAPFIATWYALGIAVPVVAGALLGPVLLRW
jgi:hypothetical protein